MNILKLTEPTVTCWNLYQELCQLELCFRQPKFYFGSKSQTFFQHLFVRIDNWLRPIVHNSQGRIRWIYFSRGKVLSLYYGTYQSRPPQPRYSSTWHVKTLLNYLQNPTTADGTLKDLTLCLGMLLVLTGTRRCSKLQKLDVLFMTITESEATFAIPVLTKNQRVGDATKVFSFPAFSDCPRLCVVHALHECCQRTSSLRSSGKLSAKPLLLSFRRPHNPVSPARWLIAVKSNAGIDTGVFKAHSTFTASAN